MIGLDIGTSSVKGVLAGEDGTRHAAVRRGYRLDVGPEGRVELDAEAVWKAARNAILTLAARAASAGVRVEAVCAGGSGDEAVWLDDAGRAVAPVPMAADRRAERVALEILAAIGRGTFSERTGLPARGAYPLFRMAWLRAVDPRSADRVRALLAWSEFVAARLGLDPVSEPTLAARSGAYDVRTRRWDRDLVAAAGADPRILPRLAETGSIVGKMSGRIANELGLAAGTPFVAGGFDQSMATLGAGVVDAGIAHVGAGSWEALTVLLPDATFRAGRDSDLTMRGFSVGPTISSTVPWSAMGSTVGGLAVRWLSSLGAASRRGPADARRLMALAARSPDRPTGLVVLTDFEGSGPREADAAGRGAIAGLGLEVDASTLARGVLEGVASGVSEQLAAVAGAIGGVSEIRVSGAGARTATWVQIHADATGIATRAVQPVDTGPIAAAALAIAAIQPDRNPDSVVRSFIRLGPLLEPRPEHLEAYRELSIRRRRLRAALADEPARARTGRLVGRGLPTPGEGPA